MKNSLAQILPFVRKPSQYLGNEINAVRKNHSQVKAKIALAFPDLYELGMSNLGLRILYHIINEQSDLLAERVFAPRQDLEQIYQEKGYLLGTLESALPLKEFDIVGFTLPYELCYTNILNMLYLGGIPLETEKRTNHDPLIIAGGSCSCNPEPMAEFFDLILIGDGEEAILDIIRTYMAVKQAGLPRDQRLREMAKIKGVYVPSFFRYHYNQEGSIQEITPLFPDYQKVTKRIVPELRPNHFPVKPVVPFPEIIHDRVAIEAARGCTRFCRFCQAGVLYRPLRERDPEQICKLARESLASTGYEELSLLSLNIGHYRFLNETVPCLMEELAPNFTALSLPSLSPGSINPLILKEIQRVRKTGFTLAPEAGTERLRNAINKRVSDEELLRDIREIVDQGWSSIKLYFMIGLPTELEEDLEGIVAVCYKIIETTRRIKGYLKNITVSVSSFVPKPHTPFQWVGQNEPGELKRKQEFLRKRLRHPRITVKFHQRELSLLEAVMSRGDRRLSRVIYEAWRLGSRFDGWTEFFDYSKWEHAFARSRLSPGFFAHRNFKRDEILPWSPFNLQVDSDFLWNQYEKSLKSEFSGDCFEIGCLNCGPCVRKEGNKRFSQVRISHPSRTKAPPHHRIRLEYEKRGEAIFLSHLELIKVFWRALRRAGIPLAYSAGFHPHPLLTFGPALAVGIESLQEIVDIQLTLFMSPGTIIKRLERELPGGLKLHSAIEIPLHSLSPSEIFVKTIFLIEPGKSVKHPCLSSYEELSEKINRFLEEDFIPFPGIEESQVKNNGNVRPLIEELQLIRNHEGELRILLTLRKNNQGKGVKPGQVLQLLFQLSDQELLTWRITKVGHLTGDSEDHGIRNNNKF